MAILSLIFFTNYVEDPAVRYQFGFYFIYLVGVNILVNLLVLLVTIIYGVYIGLRRWYKRR